MSETPLDWSDNQELAKIALELELHKDSSERTLNTPEAIGILTKHIPTLGATDLTSTRKALLGTSSSLALVSKCLSVVGLKPDAPLEGRDWIDMCYEAIEGFPNH